MKRGFLLPCALLVVLLLTSLAATGGAAPAPTAQFEAGILTAINHARAEQGLRPLRMARQLRESAAQHSWSMAVDGYFSHSSPDGMSSGVRISHYYRPFGFHIWRVGETLFWATPRATPEQLVAAWLASPEHRAIVLSNAFRQVGIGVVQAPSAPGTFAGRPVTIVTADYGLRR